MAYIIRFLDKVRLEMVVSNADAATSLGRDQPIGVSRRSRRWEIYMTNVLHAMCVRTGERRLDAL